MLRAQDKDFHLRYRLVMAALEQGLRAAARQFGCARNTVRTWVRRYQAQGKAGLQERSRRPQTVPHQTPAAVEQRVLAARRRIPCFGPRRLQENFDLPCSTGAIARILRQHRLTRSRKKPHRPRRDLSAAKMSWPPCARLQMDTKDLSDLPALQPLIEQAGFPRYQFTARLVPEGALWLAYSHFCDSTYGLLFADRLLACFHQHGVQLADLTVQTDNGSEFGGTWNRKSLPPFTRLVEQKWKCRQHRFNPPHRATHNSDLEWAHGVMEPEFYELEPFTSRPADLLARAWTYQLYFNLVRTNSNKGHRTPAELCAQRAPQVKPAIFYLPPILLSSARDSPTPQQLLVGHHVPELLTAGGCSPVQAHRDQTPAAGDGSQASEGVSPGGQTRLGSPGEARARQRRRPSQCCQGVAARSAELDLGDGLEPAQIKQEGTGMSGLQSLRRISDCRGVPCAHPTMRCFAPKTKAFISAIVW